MQKSTMSVAEMRRLLGLGKTDSYWLCHQGFFETVLVNGKMRVVIESFEDWYAMQTKHRKVTGEEPGGRLREETLTAHDIGMLLGISTQQANVLIRREELPFTKVHSQFHVPKSAFEEWYAGQTHYVKQYIREDALKGKWMTLTQMACKLGVNRSTAYSIFMSEQGRTVLERLTVGNRCYVTPDSFERWLGSQSRYNLVHSRVRSNNVQLRRPMNPAYYTVEEICRFYGYLRTEIYKKLQRGEIPAIRIGSHWRIKREEFDKMISGSDE